MGTFDKVKKFSASRPRYGGGSSARGIFHTFKTGDNIVRLVGEFIEVKTHFIAPMKSRGDRGLCISDAFEGEDKLPQVCNCPDWDIENEKPRAVKTCPICALYRSYRELQRKPGIPADEKARYEELAGKCAPRTALKWNILDRDDPYIVEATDKGERKVLGYKIATVGMEAWNDIEGIFTQCGFDISDVNGGIDINICRTEGKKTSYAARAILEGGSVKKTPLTEEEKALQLHDLKRLCGKQTDPLSIRDALHSDLMEDLEKAGGLTVAGEEGAEEEAAAPAPAPKKAAAPVAAPAAPAKAAAFTSTKTPAPAAAPKAAPAKAAPAPAAEDESAPWDGEEAEAAAPAAAAPAAEEPAAPAADDSAWACFGTIDPEHPECQACDSKVACAEKKGVPLAPAKKGRKVN
jgi:hypothetical protein